MQTISFDGGSVVHADKGLWNISFDEFSLDPCSVRILYDGVAAPVTWTLSPDGTELRGTELNASWTLQFCPGDDRDMLLKFSGHLHHKVRHLRIEILSLPQLTADHVLALGMSMGGTISRSLPIAEKTVFNGFYQTMITRNGKTLQIAFPLLEKQIMKTSGVLHENRIEDFSVGADLDHYDGTEIVLDPVQLKVSADGHRLMLDWAEKQPKPETIIPPVPGWNSWDYYRWTITEKEVLENAEFIMRDPVLSKHVKRIIVDDGWQYCYGEWEANPFFPSGMESLAKELTKMGFEPGLWFAPSLVEPQAIAAQVETELLALGENGQPCLCFSCMQRNGFVYDPTQEKVQKRLYDLFDRYSGMGYRHFKLDFLATTLKARSFADRTVPKSKIIEKLLAPIRAATKGRSLILGCNYPYFTGPSLVDSVRIGGDIHATWRGITENVTSIAARFWGNKRLWVNDPDFALCRGFDTANDPDMLKLLPIMVFNMPDDTEPGDRNLPIVDIRRPQAEILLSLVLMAGGSVNLSDKMSRLNPSGLDLARRVVSAESGEAAIPLDLFQNRRPGTWIQKLSTGHRILLINWSDSETEKSFDLSAAGLSAASVRDFWSDRTIAVRNNRIEVLLPPRSCLLGVLDA